MLGRGRRNQQQTAGWTVAQGSASGAPVIVRFDKAIGADRKRRRSLPFRVGVALPFGGKLSANDHDVLADFEDAVVEQFGRLGAELVAVITQPTFREFVFYSTTAEWVAAEHQRLQDDCDFDVQMYAAPDPEWLGYSTITNT